MKIDGSCHCGAITYEAEVDPAMVRVCHCSDCQTMSGAPFRAIVIAKEADFRVLSGEPKNYVKTAESGNKRAQGFCGECGTPIYATSHGDDGPKIYGLRLGAIKQRDQLRPSGQVWTRSAQPWIGDLADIPGLEKQS
ncbi:MAG: GFA family protein [Alphaproteobacteria bacterium]|nr:GFA family protein [Alphaproteobacteria bacterium]